MPTKKATKRAKPAARVRSYMTPAPRTIGPLRMLSEAHELMRAHRIHHLPVLAGDKLVGIVSQRDLLLIESLPGVNPAEVPVEDAMTRDVFVVDSATPLAKVAAEMADRRRGSARGDARRSGGRGVHRYRRVPGAWPASSGGTGCQLLVGEPLELRDELGAEQQDERGGLEHHEDDDRRGQRSVSCKRAALARGRSSAQPSRGQAAPRRASRWRSQLTEEDGLEAVRPRPVRVVRIDLDVRRRGGQAGPVEDRGDELEARHLVAVRTDVQYAADTLGGDRLEEERGTAALPWCLLPFFVTTSRLMRSTRFLFTSEGTPILSRHRQLSGGGRPVLRGRTSADQ